MRMNTLIQACNFNFKKAPMVGLAIDAIMLMQTENSCFFFFIKKTKPL